jgi:large subunit ribosomal protein L19
MKPQFLTKETILNINTQDRKFPDFRVGDTIQVAQVVKEGEKERTQMFVGDVIAIHKNGVASTFTIRKIGADNVGVERIYPYYSPIVSGIEVLKRGDVKRARLYYLRDKVGKSAKIKEKVVSKSGGTKAASASSSAS